MTRNTLAARGFNPLAVEPTLDRFLTGAMGRWAPDIDVEEHDDHALLKLDVPGVRPEQITINVEHRTLNIQVEREGRGSFTRQYTIGTKYDLAELKASLDFGVLTLRLPKGAEAQSRTIPVEVGHSDAS